jgi:hypothetical protein
MTARILFIAVTEAFAARSEYREEDRVAVIGVPVAVPSKTNRQPFRSDDLTIPDAALKVRGGHERECDICAVDVVDEGPLGTSHSLGI